MADFKWVFVATALLAAVPAFAQSPPGLPPLLPTLLPGPVAPPLALPAPAASSSVYSRSGNVTFGSDGTTAITSGNQTFISGPDGKTRVCQTIGAQTLCN